MYINLPAPWKQTEEIVQAFFPVHLIELTLSLGGGCTLFIVKELEESVLSMRSKKASGPDGNISEV